MKVRNQIFALILIPVLLQMATTAVLVSSFTKVDDTAKKEAAAKKVVNLSEECLALEQESILSLIVPSWTGKKTSNTTGTIMKSISEKRQELSILVQGNQRASQLVDTFGRQLTRFVENVAELGHAFDSSSARFFFSRYFSTAEFKESVTILMDQMLSELSELRDMYGAESQEFAPKAVKARSELRNNIVVFTCSYLGVVGVLAIIVNRRILARLQMLMRNMKAFSRGENSFERLEGNDELTELDVAFKKMSDERKRLDEVRKSLLAMVSHDLRSPLTAINLGVDTILTFQSEELPDQTVVILERIHSELMRLSRMANTLLDVEQLESGTLSVVMTTQTLNDIIEPAIMSTMALAKIKDVRISKDFDENASIVCDCDRTIQVLVNLISNAIKFAPAKSSITVRAGATADGGMKFDVIDEGPGVPKDQESSLFEKFSQLDQPLDIKKQGSGLGLYICRMLVTAQGGKIQHISPAEGGSCFEFALPNSCVAQVSHSLEVT